LVTIEEIQNERDNLTKCGRMLMVPLLYRKTIQSGIAIEQASSFDFKARAIIEGLT